MEFVLCGDGGGFEDWRLTSIGDGDIAAAIVPGGCNGGDAGRRKAWCAHGAKRTARRSRGCSSCQIAATKGVVSRIDKPDRSGHFYTTLWANAKTTVYTNPLLIDLSAQSPYQECNRPTFLIKDQQTKPSPLHRVSAQTASFWSGSWQTASRTNRPKSCVQIACVSK